MTKLKIGRSIYYTRRNNRRTFRIKFGDAYL